MLDYWMGFGVGLAWLLAVGHSLSKHKLAPRWLLVALFFAIGFIQLAWFGVYQGWIKSVPWLLLAHQPALFMIGPTLSLYSFYIRHDSESPGRLWWHFALPAAVAVFSLGQWLSNAEPSNYPSSLLVAASSALGGCYILPIALRLWRVRKAARYLHAETWVLMVLILIGFGVALAALTADLLQAALFYQIYLSTITAVMIASYLLGVKYPEMAHYVAEAMERGRYEKSTLGNVNVDAVLHQLRSLMEEEALYCDEQLTLARLANQLEVSTHQLSELFNEKLQQSFPSYLKAKRIEAAKALLLDQPDEPILNIGLSVGFNSSSAFYAAFREVTGMPPGKYRKQHLT